MKLLNLHLHSHLINYNMEIKSQFIVCLAFIANWKNSYDDRAGELRFAFEVQPKSVRTHDSVLSGFPQMVEGGTALPSESSELLLDIDRVNHFLRPLLRRKQLSRHKLSLYSHVIFSIQSNATR